jgi:hypothetical protein
MKNDDAIIGFIILFYGLFLLFVMIIALVTTIAKWKLLVKAGHEGWKVLIPYYGTYVLTCEVAGKDMLTFVLHCLPVVRIYAAIVTGMAIAKSFGKEDGFGIGVGLLPVVFMSILAFNKDVVYLGPGGSPKGDSTNSLVKDWQGADKPAGV